MPMPELPLNTTKDDARQVDGVREQKPVYQTHRGKVPEGHEDRKAYVQTPEGFVRYEEDQ